MNKNRKNMDIKKLLLTLILFVPILVIAQDDEAKIQKNIYGYVKNDIFWDSRQTVAAREGHFLLFPTPIVEDADGNDINAVPNFNFLSVQSRFGVKISDFDALNADISGKIEGDFFAQANDNINLFRLRHAYFKMNWQSTELLFGQTWIPMFVASCFPGTISFNTGVPFQPFGRAPQVRLTQNFGALNFVAIANSQRDYVSRGPAGNNGVYLRNSAMPELSGQIHLDIKNADTKTNYVLGAGASYKSIVPQIQTSLGYATDEKVGGFNAFGFAKIDVPAITIKLEAIYGQNMPDVLSIGGFGVTSIDTVKGVETYAPTNTASAWIDVSKKFGNVELGVFGGYTENLGMDEEIVGDLYGLGTSIRRMYRVSPRIGYQVDKVKFAIETEYTAAKYGSGFDAYAKPTSLSEVGNLRVLFAAYYFF